MAQLLVLVIDDEELASAILEEWERAGVPGVTMVESYGSRHHHDNTRDDVPFLVSLRTALNTQETHTRILFSVIEDENIVERATAAVIKVLPDFVQGHHGIMFTTPVTRMWGYVSAGKTG
ncbi:MAG TPA: hypothetical protein VFD70_26115 [Anaerolineae bacterium]|nr:hypothetical protein [Anaerolineae bacterium]